MSKVLLYDFPGSICSQMARLALVEKSVSFTRQTVDIMKTNEQFEPWYVALNPKSVVPTLRIDDEIITDTFSIVRRVDAQFEGPKLTPARPELMNAQMEQIMGLHYGVLLYAGNLTPERTSLTIVARAGFLQDMLKERPENASMLQSRIDGNRRFQAILADASEVEKHMAQARGLVDALDGQLGRTEFVAADRYSLADTFATAALARFKKLGLEDWWSGPSKQNVRRYLAAMKLRPSWKEAGVIDS